jgi:hypothetical protein
MSDFNIRADSVNVEQIMEQIRARIREKRGVDYTEQQIRELAQVKLEKMLDPRGIRPDLLDAFRQHRVPYVAPTPPLYEFEDSSLFGSRSGIVRFIRHLLSPVLKLFVNVNLLIQALHNQAAINKANHEREVARESARHELDGLYFELIHNLVFEFTRLGIEVKNLKMRVESLSSRVDFNERRERALEGVVIYKPAATEDRGEPATESEEGAQGAIEAAAPGAGARPAEGPGQRSRRRRRRRGRRSGIPAAAVMGAGSAGDATDAGPTDNAPTDAPEGGEPPPNGSGDTPPDDAEP